METLMIIGIYLGATTVGVLISEFRHFNKNQKYYARGAKTVKDQIKKYFFHRWDNLISGIFMGMLIALIVHSTSNSAAATTWLLDKLGMEGLNISLSGYALVALLSAFGSWIAVKVGIVKEDKLED